MTTNGKWMWRALSAACLAVVAGSAAAESQYGFASSGTGVITAQARVNLQVSVPKLILLRVGSSNTTQDALSWSPSLSIPAVPTTPVTGNTTNVDWNGTAPTVVAATNPAALSVFAWTNSSGGGSLSYSALAFASGGPSLSDISVTAGSGLAHPAPTALATASTTAVTFSANTLASGSWSYALNSTGAASWAAGTYSSTVTYTATSL